MAPIATYHYQEDPMDDFALSLENAQRWACSKRPFVPEGTFYPFAELPSELRQMVWRECIPGRIHLACEPVRGNDFEGIPGDHRTLSSAEERQSGLYPFHGRHCRTVYPRTLGRESHFIAKVNKEASDVSEGKKPVGEKPVGEKPEGNTFKSKCYNLAFVFVCAGMFLGRVTESPVWVDKDKDTVLINTSYMPPIRHPPGAVFLTKDDRLEFKADRLFGMAIRNKIKVAIFAAILADWKAPLSFYHDLTRAKRVDVVVGVLGFEGISDDEAAATELFGLFGEESMGLVPAGDTRSLQRLFRAERAFRPHRIVESLEGCGQRPGRAGLVELCKSCRCGPRLPDDSNAYPQLPDDLDAYLDNLDAYLQLPDDLDAYPQLPDDLDAYCKRMRKLASTVMVWCKEELMWRPFGEGDDRTAAREWQERVAATFKDTFEPVFLVHRCSRSVLIDCCSRAF